MHSPGPSSPKGRNDSESLNYEHESCRGGGCRRSFVDEALFGRDMTNQSRSREPQPQPPICTPVSRQQQLDEENQTPRGLSLLFEQELSLRKVRQRSNSSEHFLRCCSHPRDEDFCKGDQYAPKKRMKFDYHSSPLSSCQFTVRYYADLFQNKAALVDQKQQVTCEPMRTDGAWSTFRFCQASSLSVSPSKGGKEDCSFSSLESVSPIPYDDGKLYPFSPLHFNQEGSACEIESSTISHPSLCSQKEYRFAGHNTEDLFIYPKCQKRKEKEEITYLKKGEEKLRINEYSAHLQCPVETGQISDSIIGTNRFFPQNWWLID